MIRAEDRGIFFLTTHRPVEVVLGDMGINVDTATATVGAPTGKHRFYVVGVDHSAKRRCDECGKATCPACGQGYLYIEVSEGGAKCYCYPCIDAIKTKPS